MSYDGSPSYLVGEIDAANIPVDAQSSNAAEDSCRAPRIRDCPAVAHPSQMCGPSSFTHIEEGTLRISVTTNSPAHFGTIVITSSSLFLTATSCCKCAVSHRAMLVCHASRWLIYSSSIYWLDACRSVPEADDKKEQMGVREFCVAASQYSLLCQCRLVCAAICQQVSVYGLIYLLHCSFALNSHWTFVSIPSAHQSL